MKVYHLPPGVIYVLGENIEDASQYLFEGTRVRLKDGSGPTMLVQRQTGGRDTRIVCVWGEPDNIRTAEIAPGCLEVVT